MYLHLDFQVLTTETAGETVKQVVSRSLNKLKNSQFYKLNWSVLFLRLQIIKNARQEIESPLSFFSFLIFFLLSFVGRQMDHVLINK